MTANTTPPAPIKRLLVVCSPEEDDTALLQSASHLADKLGASLTVMSAAEAPSELHRIAEATGLPDGELEHRMLDDQRQVLAAEVARTLPGYDDGLIVTQGTRFIDIIGQVQDGPFDMVIKSAEELDGLHRYLFASTDQHLLRKCPCPVWLRLRDSTEPVKTVLATVDVDLAMASEPETLEGLNQQIMAVALQIAASTGAVLHVLHVWDAPGEGLVKLWANAADTKAAAEAYVNDVQATHAKALETLMVQSRKQAEHLAHQPVDIRPCLGRGTAREVIPQHVSALGADLLVMGTIARTGVPGFIIGNTAEDVLNAVECSVVTVKPPSYVSPVARSS